MKRLHILLLFAALVWLGSGRTRLLAQEPPRSPLTPPSEETTANPSEPPTPQFMQVEVDLGAGGLNIRLRTHPAWQARYRPYVRVGQARTEPRPRGGDGPAPAGWSRWIAPGTRTGTRSRQAPDAAVALMHDSRDLCPLSLRGGEGAAKEVTMTWYMRVLVILGIVLGLGSASQAQTPAPPVTASLLLR